MDPITIIGARAAGAIAKRLAESILTKRSAPATASAATMATSNAAGAQVAENAAIGVKSSAQAADTFENGLGKNEFLRLLVMQMQNQDPLDPIDNSEMVAQLAQFSALEQMTNLNTSFETLSGNFDQLNFLSASSMLGRTVSGLSPTGEIISGLVEKVQMDGSVIFLTVDGQLLSMANVLSVE